MATTYLERGTQAQYQTLQNLHYIEKVGKKLDIGNAYSGDHLCCAVKALDTTAFEQLMAPAYTGIEGSYPKKSGEIMLSWRALKTLGIEDASVGMKISMRLEYNLVDQIEEEFTLSGYFKDYVSAAGSQPIGYLSQEQAEELGKSWNQPDELLIEQKDTIGKAKIEEKLYNDVEMTDESQRFFGGNTFVYEAVEQLAGGYKVALSCGFLILVSVFLLIQNVISISMRREMQQYGLLYTLGTTRRQQRRIFFRQISRTAFFSVLLGGTALGIVMGLFLPHMLGKLYLQQAGGSVELRIFHLGIFGGSIGFVVAVLYLAAGWSFYKTKDLQPLEALKNIGEAGRIDPKKKSEKRRKNAKHQNAKRQNEKHQIAYMAWKNLMRYPRRLSLTILSLFLGITVALGTVVIGTGLDQTNEIDQRPDFVIENTVSTANSESQIEAGVDWFQCNYDEFSPISEELKERILSIDGVEETSIQTAAGGYLMVHDEGDGLFARTNAIGFSKKEFDEYKKYGLFLDAAVVQIVDETYLEQLSTYAQEKDLPIDAKGLRSGAEVLLLHPHLLSPAQEELAGEAEGKPLLFARLNTKEWCEARAEQTEGMSLGELWNWSEGRSDAEEQEEAERWAAAVTLPLAGYADTTREGFPPLEMERSIDAEGTLYLLTGREGFEKLGTSEKTFRMSFDVEKGQEAQVKQSLKILLAQENRGLHISETDKGLQMTAKSDLLEEARSSIQINQIIMGSLSIMLIFMGILNYLNVMVTGMLARREEFLILNSIGMTRHQLQKMLMLEGAYYVLIAGTLVATLGSGLLAAAAWYTKQRVSYFRFAYPVWEVVVILVVLGVICVGGPVVLEGRKERK